MTVDAESMSSARRRRICLITVEFHGLFKNGGIGTANTALALALADNGFDVTVAFANADASGPRLAMGDFAQLQNYWGARGIKLDYVRPHPNLPGSFDDPRSASFCVYLYLKNKEFDIVLLNDNGGQGYYSLIAKHTGVFENPPLFCLVAHGPVDWVHELNALEYYSRQPVIISYLERRSAALADILVSPSQYLLDWMRQRNWIPRNHGRVVQNLTGVESLNIGDAERSRRLPVTEIVFFGRQETRKGVTLFCDALDLLSESSSLNDIRVTFLGKFGRLGALHSGVYIAERARSWRSPLRILTVYNQAEALQYLQRPGVLAVMPSQAENSPCVVAECLQLGILFLASDGGGTVELVAAEDGDECLFSPNAAALAKRLEAILEHGQRPARMALSQSDTQAQWIRLLTDPQASGAAARAESDSRPSSPQQGASSALPTVAACIVWSNSRQSRACFEDLRRQSYRQLDIVIAADESAAASGALPAEERGITILIGEYTTVGAARNAAARRATSDYLLFIDEATTRLQPNGVRALALAANHTGADILTAVRDLDGEVASSNPASRGWDFPVGACSELGMLENCFGEGALLVKWTYFSGTAGFSEDCEPDLLGWLFMAGAVLQGASLEVAPGALVRISEEKPWVIDGERTVGNHRRILQLYRLAPIETILRIAESTLQVSRANNMKMQRALRGVGKAAGDIAMRLATLDANSPEASRQFIQYCCERRQVELAIDFALHNDLPFLPDAVTAARRANEAAARDQVRARQFDVQHTIDLCAELQPRAHAVHGLRGGDIVRAADGSIQYPCSSGDCVVKIARATPPGTRAVRLTVRNDGGEAVQVAGVLCQSWARPVLSDEGIGADVDVWWSGWVDAAGSGAYGELGIDLPRPCAELLDLYLVARSPEADSTEQGSLSWTRIAVVVSLVGDLTPSVVELKTVAALQPLSFLKRGRLLTDVSGVDFAVFVPGERTMLHPLIDRLSLVQVAEALPPGTSGLRYVVSVEHPQAHSIEFAVWARPASDPIAEEKILNETAHFSGWLLVDKPHVRRTLTLKLPQPIEQPFDIYLATRIVNASDSYFCHAYWHECHLFKEPRDTPARQIPIEPTKSLPPPKPDAGLILPPSQSQPADAPPRRSGTNIRRSYLICAAPRTGSNLLANALRDSRLGGWPLEYFNVQSMNDDNMLKQLGLLWEPGTRNRAVDLPDLSSRLQLIRRAGTLHGIFGATLHWSDMDNLLDAISENTCRDTPRIGHAPDGLRSYFPDLVYIRLRRENRVAQAISHYIAIQTNAWSIPRDGMSNAAREGVDVEFDFAAIKKLVDHAEEAETHWREFLAGSEDLTLSVTYEELAADFSATVSKVLAFIGTPLPPGAVPPPAFVRQADARSVEWELRYRELARALRDAPDSTR